MKHSRAVIVTAFGKRGFMDTFGIKVSEEDGAAEQPRATDSAARSSGIRMQGADPNYLKGAILLKKIVCGSFCKFG
jgi:hypothetical protein